ncbi:NrsF family protein [Muricoccus vinaceus]|uniref:NrsF family protein n=1 Tax=Muricoccus vinaceus TaxID=424704 RepID=A0ABV6IV91_9PROT
MKREEEVAIAARTDGLIDRLAAQAGRSRLGGPLTFKVALVAAALASLGLSVALVLAWIGARPDLAMRGVPFAYKIASMLALGLAGLALACRAALPGRGKLTATPFLPAVLILAFRAATDRSGLSALGSSDISAGGCVLTILGASLPPLIILFGVMRMGAVTRPVAAGAIVGALSGSLGAIAYALACKNDAGLFVAIWYPLAVMLTAAVGAITGKRALTW